MNKRQIDGIIGLAVGDALGVPYEFIDRDKMKENPATGMTEYGTHWQPKGTWSDDTSLTLATIVGLKNGFSQKNVMDEFVGWYYSYKYTPHGEMFDIGDSTAKAIWKYKDGIPADKCGGINIMDNGNGALMRILPMVYYIFDIYGFGFETNSDALYELKCIGGITHAHEISEIACGIYASIAGALLFGCHVKTAIETGATLAKSGYNSYNCLDRFHRIFSYDLFEVTEEDIKSSGYVVDTLEAALWCLYNTDNYKDCVLKAVNLGGDTDTIAAIAGSLAGIAYGEEGIPKEWLDSIVKLDEIRKICE